MTTNPWDIPPFPAKGDEEDRIIFESVGRALSAWERFETYLFRLYLVVLDIQSWWLPAERAYGAIATSRARIDMLKSASNAYLFGERRRDGSEELRAEMAVLFNRSGDYASRRNEIAHGLVMRYDDAYVFDDRTGFVLTAPVYSTNKRKLSEHSLTVPSYIYSSVEIDHFRKCFEGLHPMAHSIIAKIEERRRS